MNWRVTALVCFAGLALSPAAVAQQTAVYPLVRTETPASLFRSICMATRANAALAAAAALAEGFVRASDGASGAPRYQNTIGATTYTMMTVTENYTPPPGQKETCVIIQEPGDPLTTAAVAALMGGMPALAEGELSAWQLVEEAGQLNLLRLEEDERAQAAARTHTLYYVTVTQTAAKNMIIYEHW